MERVRELIEHASEAAFAIDDCSHVTAWNHQAEQLFGYASDEVIDRHCGEILQAVLAGGEPLCTPNCEISRCFRNCVPYRVPSCRIRRKDGNWVSVRISSLIMTRQTWGLSTNSVIAIVFLYEKEHEHRQVLSRETLQVFTLGCFGLAAGGIGIPLEKWKRKQAVTLLKYLATQVGCAVHRERILDSLWPDIDEDRGWNRLKVTMSCLRRALRTAGMDDGILITVGDAYLLRRDAVTVDAERFETLAAEGWALQRQQQWDEALRRYDQAAHLYRGDYLEEDAYADWCAEERARLRELRLEVFADMAHCFAELGQYTEAARVCRSALVREPCRESFHRMVMEYLVRLGRPDQAVAQYHTCQRVLAEGLGVDPMPETQRLYQQIRAGQTQAVAKVSAK